MTYYVGIDVSKDKLDVFVSGNVGQFENNSNGFKALVSWLKKKKVFSNLHACLESTGKYGQELAEYLHEKKVKVSIVNPCLIKSFALSLGKRNKTDSIDSEVIARFCEVNEPSLWEPPPESVKALIELTRTIEDLKKQRQALNNRLEGKLNKTVENSLKEIVKHLDEQINLLEKKASEIVSEDNDLKGKVSLLQTIPGIGEKSAIRFMAEIPNIENYTNAKCLAATFGITPKQRLSGSSVNSSSISKLGNRRLRKAFFLPALSAKIHNPIVKNFCKQLSERGKKAKQIICAAMRKLVHIVYGVLKSGKPFDPNYQNLSLSS